MDGETAAMVLDVNQTDSIVIKYRYPHYDMLPNIVDGANIGHCSTTIIHHSLESISLWMIQLKGLHLVIGMYCPHQFVWGTKVKQELKFKVTKNHCVSSIGEDHHWLMYDLTS